MAPQATLSEGQRAETKELLRLAVGTRLTILENIVESSNVCINQINKQLDTKLKGLLEFFPIDELKEDDITTGEQYVAAMIKAA